MPALPDDVLVHIFSFLAVDDASSIPTLLAVQLASKQLRAASLARSIWEPHLLHRWEHHPHYSPGTPRLTAVEEYARRAELDIEARQLLIRLVGLAHDRQALINRLVDPDFGAQIQEVLDKMSQVSETQEQETWLGLRWWASNIQQLIKREAALRRQVVDEDFLLDCEYDRDVLKMIEALRGDPDAYCLIILRLAVDEYLRRCLKSLRNADYDTSEVWDHELVGLFRMAQRRIFPWDDILLRRVTHDVLPGILKFVTQFCQDVVDESIDTMPEPKMLQSPYDIGTVVEAPDLSGQWCVVIRKWTQTGESSDIEGVGFGFGLSEDEELWMYELMTADGDRFRVDSETLFGADEAINNLNGLKRLPQFCIKGASHLGEYFLRGATDLPLRLVPNARMAAEYPVKEAAISKMETEGEKNLDMGGDKEEGESDVTAS